MMTCEMNNLEIEWSLCQPWCNPLWLTWLKAPSDWLIWSYVLTCIQTQKLTIIEIVAYDWSVCGSFPYISRAHIGRSYTASLDVLTQLLFCWVPHDSLSPSPHPLLLLLFLLLLSPNTLRDGGSLQGVCSFVCVCVQLYRVSVPATAADEEIASTVTVSAGKASMENTALSVSPTKRSVLKTPLMFARLGPTRSFWWTPSVCKQSISRLNEVKNIRWRIEVISDWHVFGYI